MGSAFPAVVWAWPTSWLGQLQLQEEVEGSNPSSAARNELTNEVTEQLHLVLSQAGPNQLLVAINTSSLFSFTQQASVATILARSTAYLVRPSSAQMYYPALIWFWAKGSRQQRLMVLFPFRQITPDSACRGVGLAHTSSATADAAAFRREEAKPFLHLMQIEGHIERWSQDGRADVAPSAPHHMIHASAAPGTNPHMHGVICVCVSPTHTHSDTQTHC